MRQLPPYSLSMLLLLVVPLLTMRLFAEEWRLGTLELLLTYPIRDAELCLAKFAACAIVCAVLLAGTWFYPLFLARTEALPFAPLACGYVGLYLLALSFIGCGMFFSSLTDNQIIAAIMTFAVLLVLWLADNFGQNIGAPMSDIFRYLSVTQQFQDFPRGVIDTTHVVYFLSLVVGCLVLATLSIQSRRWR